jgi:hypothetical protein
MQHFGKGADRRQRRPQFVGDRRNEVILHAVEFAQALVGLAQFGGRRLEFTRLAFEFPAVGAHLRRFVEYVEHLIPTPRGSSRATEATITRALAEPMAPASSASAKRTKSALAGNACHSLTPCAAAKAPRR